MRSELYFSGRAAFGGSFILNQLNLRWIGYILEILGYFRIFFRIFLVLGLLRGLNRLLGTLRSHVRSELILTRPPLAASFLNQLSLRRLGKSEILLRKV